MAHVISTPKPEEEENETLELTRRRIKWENDDFICRGHILDSMKDPLFDIYQFHESANILWNSIQDNTWPKNDASSKKVLVNAYKMVDNRPIIDQFHDYNLCSLT